MEYIGQIRAFYDVLSVKPLSTGQIALWHALMNINNRCYWEEWFTVANITLELSCSLSRRGIYDARNALKQAGLIDFKSNGTKASLYTISLLYFSQGTAQVTAQGTAQVTAQVTATLIRPKTKDIDKEKDILTDIKKEKPPALRFVKPTIAEIELHCQARKNSIDATSFFNFYESKGWLIGKNHMKDWKAAIVTWERKEKKDNQQAANPYLRGDLFDNTRNTNDIGDAVYCIPELSQGQG